MSNNYKQTEGAGARNNKDSEHRFNAQLRLSATVEGLSRHSLHPS
jgi:hypothetical protein